MTTARSLKVSEAGNFDFILDAWALLAHFENEAGAEKVAEVLKSAAQGKCSLGMSVINLGEVAYITERERGLDRVHAVLAAIHSFAITILPVDEKEVLIAAHLKANYRLSYADAVAAATAQLWGGKLLTGDPELRALDGREITIEWLPG
jgi:predicted nucleic acid-binding protein